MPALWLQSPAVLVVVRRVSAAAEVPFLGKLVAQTLLDVSSHQQPISRSGERVTRLAHNQETAGATPASATKNIFYTSPKVVYTKTVAVQSNGIVGRLSLYLAH